MKLNKADTTERAATVDELGALEAELAELDPKFDRAKALRSEVDSWTAKTPAAATVSYSGVKYSVTCGPRKNERTVNTAGLREFLGDGFYEVATVALGAIDKVALRLPKVTKFISTARTGKRTITTAQKAA